MFDFIKHSSIKFKINLIAFFAMFIIATILLSIWLFFNYLEKNFQEMQQNELKLQQISHNLKDNISTFHNNIIAISLLKSQSAITQKEITDLNQIIADEFKFLEKSSSSIEHFIFQQNLKKLKLRFQAYQNIALSLPEEFSHSQEDGLDSLIAINSISAKMFGELEVFINLADKHFEERLLSIQTNMNKVMDIFFIIAIFSLIIFSFLGFLLAKSIMLSLNTLSVGIDNFFKFLSKETEHTDDIQIIYNDELGKIAQNINDNIHEAEHLIANERLFQAQLELEVHKQTEEIASTQRDVIQTLSQIGESRSKETGNHVKRVASYSKLFAHKYGLSDDECELLYTASPMHDIGKLGVPDDILNKPSKLESHEYDIIKNHTLIGYEMLKNSNRPLMKTAAIISLEHHEKYDGTGYPNKKSGEDIHIFGRITAIADVFDALGTSRCYKDAWDLSQILEFFKDEKGRHFDPKLVDIFMDNIYEFIKIREYYKDTH